MRLRLLVAFLLAVVPVHGRDDTNAPPRARLTVRGLGWLDNLELKGLLRQLRPDRKSPEAFTANEVEDGAFLLLRRAERMGFLQATVSAELSLTNNQTLTLLWSTNQAPDIPRPLAATRVDYRVETGPRFHYVSVTFEGLTAIPAHDARRYFVRTDGLLQTRVLRRFSRSELEEALASLRTSLRQRGLADAQVRVASLEIDPATAAVSLRVAVQEGPVHHVRAVQLVVRDAPKAPSILEETRTDQRLLSGTTRQDLERELLVEWYREGYPDAEASLTEIGRNPRPDGSVEVTLRADITRGPRVQLGQSRFSGAGAKRFQDALERRTRLEGPWLDRLAIDEARTRLGRVGGFKFVNVRYDIHEDPSPSWDPVFELEPGREFTIDVLAGFRSYELLYGGVEILRRNLFGLGHTAELRLLQSFKSSDGYVTYSIPDAFAEGVTLFALVNALSREEVSFRREELRGSLGARKLFEASDQQVGLRYNYEVLRALDAPVSARTLEISEDQPLVSSFVAEWSLERRDSAVTPREGFYVGTLLEFALPEFGGEARFLRPELDASWHQPLGGGRYLSLGTHLTAIGYPDGDGLVPFNKRIFPGGDDSVRGYQRGEAAPTNAAGEIIGAEIALVWNLEFEQLLTPSWSLVAFADGVAEAADINASPVDEVLWSVGGGIRWNTVIGPVRLEYGYNLQPRPVDPTGTLHFSVGFPF